MPELPEVEVARRQLTRWGRGRTVREVVLVDPKLVAGHAADAAADGAQAVRDLKAAHGAWKVGPRRGKRLGLRIGAQGWCVHLGMTGRWVRRTDPERPRGARVGLVLDDGAVVWLVDDRRFARWLPVDDVEAAVADGLGPDALAPLSGGELAAAMAGRGPMKALLMDQRRLAGLGNIHAVEALHRAHVSPFANPRDLDAPAWTRLARAIHTQLEEAVSETDAEEVAYLSDGKHVANPFRVYGREGQPCPACGAAVARRAQGGRSTYWCPRCQPDPLPAA